MGIFAKIGEIFNQVGVLTLIMVFFSILGAIDRILGNHFGLGKQFEKGFMLDISSSITADTDGVRHKGQHRARRLRPFCG